MVAGDEDNRCLRQCLAQPLNLPERKDDGVVAGSDRMEEIASEDYHIWSSGNDAVNGGAEGLGKVGFPLIYPGRSLPMVLPDAQMGIRDMGQFHGWRMGAKAAKSKNLWPVSHRKNRPAA
jgi:hypothetical protein